jgi:hypothetical protein
MRFKENPNKAAFGVILDRLQLLCREGEIRMRYSSLGTGLKVHNIEPYLISRRNEFDTTTMCGRYSRAGVILAAALSYARMRV